METRGVRVDGKDLGPLFVSTVGGRLAALRRLLGHLSHNADDALVWGRVGDSLEFLEGEARQASFPAFLFVLEAMLSVPRAVRDGHIRVSPAHLQFLFLLLEYLDALTADPEGESRVSIPRERIQTVVLQIEAREAFGLQDLSLAAPRAQKSETQDSSKDLGTGDEAVTIALQKLDGLAQRLDAVIVRQFQLKKHSDVLQGLLVTAHGLASDLKNQTLEGPAELLVKDLQRLDQGFKDDITALDRVAFQFQEELARFRMVPFQLDGPEWKALAASPKAEVVVTNHATQLERSLLNKVQAPLLELVRNALVHGVETPEARTSVGKDPRGRIDIVCRSDRSSISIEVRDDGQGVDAAQIRRSAQAAFPMEHEELEVMSVGQLLGYLFKPGVTAAAQETREVSGRGLGLEAVKNALDRLQGRISVATEPGKGTVFTLQFPASASLVQGFFLQAGGERFFVSSVFVKEIVLFSRADLISLPNGAGYRIRDLVVPILPLASALAGKESVQKPVEQMVVVELLGETFGLVVDSILRHAALSYKALPDSLSGMNEVTGVVYDEKFNLVPILHLPAVLVHLRRLRSLEFRDRYSPDRLEYKNILVVDDGPTSRQTLVQVLRDARYNVEAAGDGIEAMEAVEDRHFHLIITDQAMPRMDGPTFVENLRKKPEYLKTPVIALRGDNPEAEASLRSKDVTVFLEKSNFSRQELLDHTARLLLKSP